MSDAGATAMREAADKAVKAAKAALIRVAEAELPISDDPKNGMRQIGAIITATSELYGALLATNLNAMKKDPDTGQNIVNLTAGMFATMVGDNDIGVVVIQINGDNDDD